MSASRRWQRATVVNVYAHKYTYAVLEANEHETHFSAHYHLIQPAWWACPFPFPGPVQLRTATRAIWMRPNQSRPSTPWPHHQKLPQAVPRGTYVSQSPCKTCALRMERPNTDPICQRQQELAATTARPASTSLDQRLTAYHTEDATHLSLGEQNSAHAAKVAARDPDADLPSRRLCSVDGDLPAFPRRPGLAWGRTVTFPGGWIDALGRAKA